jgi:ribosomal protein L33
MSGWAVVEHTYDPSTWEAEAGGFLWVQGQLGLWSKFQGSQGYTEKKNKKQKQKRCETKKPCLENNKQTNKQINACMPQ